MHNRLILGQSWKAIFPKGIKSSYGRGLSQNTHRCPGVTKASVLKQAILGRSTSFLKRKILKESNPVSTEINKIRLLSLAKNLKIQWWFDSNKRHELYQGSSWSRNDLRNESYLIQAENAVGSDFKPHFCFLSNALLISANLSEKIW